MTSTPEFNFTLTPVIDAPVLFVGKAGIGAAIDDTILAVSFMQQQGIKNIAIVYNKIPSSELISIKRYVSNRLSELLPNVPILDFIVNHSQLTSQAKHQSATKISHWFNSLSFS